MNLPINTQNVAKAFIITQRHYDMIIKQAIDCYPEETGGIFGGKDLEILSVFPIFNKGVDKRTSQFGLSGEDIERGHIFVKKHKMQYLGIYHTHPKGIAYPSDADLSHNQKYLFIISLAEKGQPDFRAYEVHNKQPLNIPIIVRPNEGTTVIDTFTGKPVNPQNNDVHHEFEKLQNLIGDIVENKVRYEKKAPEGPYQSFNTTA